MICCPFWRALAQHENKAQWEKWQVRCLCRGDISEPLEPPSFDVITFLTCQNWQVPRRTQPAYLGMLSIVYIYVTMFVYCGAYELHMSVLKLWYRHVVVGGSRRYHLYQPASEELFVGPWHGFWVRINQCTGIHATLRRIHRVYHCVCEAERSDSFTVSWLIEYLGVVERPEACMFPCYQTSLYMSVRENREMRLNAIFSTQEGKPCSVRVILRGYW